MIHSTSIVDDGASVGETSNVWHFCHVDKTGVIGENCVIGQGCYIAGTIGNGVHIQNGVLVCKGVTLEDDVFIGPNVGFTNIKVPRSFINRKHALLTTLIKKGASVGANVTIIAGVTIGEYAMIGAGSVVTKDVLPYELYYGNPAEHKGWVCRCGKKLDFLTPITACKDCGLRYELKSGVKQFDTTI